MIKVRKIYLLIKICSYLKQQLLDVSFKTEINGSESEKGSLKTPFSKVKLIPPNSNKLSKTPQKKLMSPDPEIK